MAQLEAAPLSVSQGAKTVRACSRFWFEGSKPIAITVIACGHCACVSRPQARVNLHQPLHSQTDLKHLSCCWLWVGRLLRVYSEAWLRLTCQNLQH